MSERTYTATRLKAELLGVLDAVERTGDAVVVTKRGRPVAKLVPIDVSADLRGSLTFLVGDEALIEPLDVVWEADRPDPGGA